MYSFHSSHVRVAAIHKTIPTVRPEPASQNAATAASFAMSARQLALGFGSLATVRKRWRFDDGATAR